MNSVCMHAQPSRTAQQHAQQSAPRPAQPSNMQHPQHNTETCPEQPNYTPSITQQHAMAKQILQVSLGKRCMHHASIFLKYISKSNEVRNVNTHICLSPPPRFSGVWDPAGTVDEAVNAVFRQTFRVINSFGKGKAGVRTSTFVEIAGARVQSFVVRHRCPVKLSLS